MLEDHQGLTPAVCRRRRRPRASPRAGLVLPLLGVLVYLIAHGKDLGGRRLQSAGIPAGYPVNGGGAPPTPQIAEAKRPPAPRANTRATATATACATSSRLGFGRAGDLRAKVPRCTP